VIDDQTMHLIHLQIVDRQIVDVPDIL